MYVYLSDKKYDVLREIILHSSIVCIVIGKTNVSVDCLRIVDSKSIENDCCEIVCKVSDFR